MWIRTIFLVWVILSVSLISVSTYAFATGETGQHEHKGSIMEQGKKGSMMEHMKEKAVAAVEAGNEICPVSGEKIGTMGPAVQHEYKGKIYNFCCPGCVGKFKDNPEEYIKEKEAAAVEAGNELCPVSGEKIGTMGPAVQHEYKGKIYNFCCPGCVGFFKADPEKYVKTEKAVVTR